MALFGRARVDKKEEGKYLLIREATNVHADYVTKHHKCVQWKLRKTERIWLPVSLGKQSPTSQHAATFHFGYTNKPATF